MKIKHICSFFALCCAMNISDLSATLSSVHNVFKSNIEKNLKGHENDIVRKCSYLNQLNTTSELWKIAYDKWDFIAAVDAVVDHVKELAREKSTFQEAFKKLSKENRVAAVFALKFLTGVRCDLGGKNWIDVFHNNYSGKETDVKNFVTKIRYSEELKIVDKYYYDAKAVAELKELLDRLLNSTFNEGRKLKFIALLDRCVYKDVYESYRELDGKAVWEAFIDAIDEDDRKNYLLSPNEKFDLLSEEIFKRNGDNGVKLTSNDLKEKGGFLGLLGSVRKKHENYKEVKETDIKNFVFFDAEEKRERSLYVARCKSRLHYLKTIANIFEASIDLSKAEKALEVAGRGYTVTIFQGSSDEKPGKTISITNRNGVTQENYAKVLAAIPKVKPTAEVAEEYKNLKIVKEVKEQWEEIEAIEAAAEEKKEEIERLTEEINSLKEKLSNALDSGDYSAEKIGELNTADKCKEMMEKIEEELKKINDDNKKLGDAKIEITALTEKVKGAKEKIEEKEQITKKLEAFLAKFGDKGEYGEEKIRKLSFAMDCCSMIKEIEAELKKIKGKAQKLKGKLGYGDKAVTEAVEKVTKKVEEAIRSITKKGSDIIETYQEQSFYSVMLSIRILLLDLNDGGKYSKKEIEKLNDADTCDKMIKLIEAKFKKIESDAGHLNSNDRKEKTKHSLSIEKMLKKANAAAPLILTDEKKQKLYHSIKNLTNKVNATKKEIKKKKGDIEKKAEARKEEIKKLEDEIDSPREDLLAKFKENGDYSKDAIEKLIRTYVVSDAYLYDRIIKLIEATVDEIKENKEKLGYDKIDIAALTGEINAAKEAIEATKEEIKAAAEAKKKEETDKLTKELDTFLDKFDVEGEYGEDAIRELGDAMECCYMIEGIEAEFEKIKWKAQELKDKLGGGDEAITGAVEEVEKVTKKVEEVTTKVNEAIRSIINEGERIINEGERIINEGERIIKKSKDKKSLEEVMLRIRIMLRDLEDGGKYSKEEIEKLHDANNLRKMFEEINEKFKGIKLDKRHFCLNYSIGIHAKMSSLYDELTNKVNTAKEEINKKPEIEEAEKKKRLKEEATKMVERLSAKFEDSGVYGKNAIDNLTKAISCDIKIKEIERDVNEIKKKNEEIKLARIEEINIEELTGKAEKAKKDLKKRIKEINQAAKKRK